MIPRRIYGHVKSHNWFAVFLDFVIVVAGVFIGLQASNWNAARADRAREDAYLAGIATDIRADIAEIEEIIRVATVRQSALAYVLTEAGGPLPDGFNSARGRIEIEPSPPFSERASGSAGIALFILTTLEGGR